MLRYLSGRSFWIVQSRRKCPPFLDGSVGFDINDVPNSKDPLDYQLRIWLEGKDLLVLSQVCRELDHTLLLEVARERIL